MLNLRREITRIYRGSHPPRPRFRCSPSCVPHCKDSSREAVPRAEFPHRPCAGIRERQRSNPRLCRPLPRVIPKWTSYINGRRRPQRPLEAARQWAVDSPRVFTVSQSTLTLRRIPDRGRRNRTIPSKTPNCCKCDSKLPSKPPHLPCNNHPRRFRAFSRTREEPVLG